MTYPKETELLLLLSRVSPEHSVFEKGQAFIDSGIDWGELTRLSLKHSTANLIYKNLLKLNNIPQQVLDKFKNIYNQSIRTNILMVSELDRLIDGLRSKGIEVIALKGVPASEEIFGNIGLYPSGDLDILVKVHEIQPVTEFLETEGYRLNDEGFNEYREFFIKELYHISLSGPGFTIEPHWNLFFRYFTAPPEFWWDERVAVSSGGREYLFLSPEKNVLYTAFRLFTKLFTPLKFLVMVAEIVRHYRDVMDWEKLFRYAQRYKFQGVIRMTLNLSRGLLGAPVPERYAELKGLRTKVFFRLVRRMVLQGAKDHPLGKIFLIFLRDDLRGAFGVLFRRLFPSKGEIVSRYRVPVNSGKAMIYYVLNPLLLLMRRHQKT